MPMLSLVNGRPLLVEPAIRLPSREWRVSPKSGLLLPHGSLMNEGQVLGSRFERSNTEYVGDSRVIRRTPQSLTLERFLR